MRFRSRHCNCGVRGTSIAELKPFVAIRRAWSQLCGSMAKIMNPWPSFFTPSTKRAPPTLRSNKRSPNPTRSAWPGYIASDCESDQTVGSLALGCVPPLISVWGSNDILPVVPSEDPCDTAGPHVSRSPFLSAQSCGADRPQIRFFVLKPIAVATGGAPKLVGPSLRDEATQGKEQKLSHAITISLTSCYISRMEAFVSCVG